LTRPLSDLVDAVDRFRSGDLTSRVADPDGDYEIAHLGETINKMAKEIEILYTDMEERVHERTAQLENTNAQIESMLENIGE